MDVHDRAGSSAVVASDHPYVLGEPGALLRFGEGQARGAWPGQRLLWVGEEPAFKLSFWCGTCQFLFRRLPGASETQSRPVLSDTLAQGLVDLDQTVVTEFSALLERGEYLPLLLTLTPRLVRPSGPGDYFAEEQLRTWGPDTFWGLPVYPATPYYRTFETTVHPGAHLFEFIAPMVPPSWNQRPIVDRYRKALVDSAAPTAVAVSILDVCAPAVDHGVDYYEHWALTHFLLDGHHKVQAAAETNLPLRLLSLVSLAGGLATRDQVLRLPGLRAQDSVRPTAGSTAETRSSS